MNVAFSRRLGTGLFLLIAAVHSARAADNVVSLAGSWDFIRGGPALAASPAARPELKFADTIQLPGTTETNRKGPVGDHHAEDGLTFPWAFVGPCWYARDITIPDAWRDQRVTLLLERTKYTQVWLDDKPIGDNVICCTAQEYELGSAVAPGKHRLTVAVDNKRIPPMGADAHQFSGATQGNWNGIIGKIELRATPTVWIEQVQAFPSASDHYVHVKVRIKSVADAAGEGTVSFRVNGPGVSATHLPEETISWTQGIGEIEEPIDLYPDAKLWDEFHPNLQKLVVHFHSKAGDDERQVIFGLRDFAAHGQQFTLNDQSIFLRGKHDGCVFPLTGHPPMDVEGWLAYFRVLKSYGLNHVRFHTWTPPEAAFVAADQLGFYLQPELPFWGPFNEKVKETLKPEALGILRQFGNHPSFVMFSMGNEHWAGAEALDALVAELKTLDTRHLYIRGSNAFAYRGRPGPKDDYYIGADLAAADGKPTKHIRAANTGVGEALGHVQLGPANTMADYADALAGTQFPSITHEMGQYTVFPDFRQLTKYTGVTRPFNLEHFQKTLADAGMADQDEAFAAASGALAAICYREEIESCLRTPGFGGFELLDLQDYPGQGSALVGMLDVFMDSKNILTPQQWRQFCSPTVLLARFAKYVWTTDENFAATIDIADYGERSFKDAAIDWQLLDSSGKTVRDGSLNAASISAGTLSSIGSLSIPLGGLAAPAKLELMLRLKGTEIETKYPVWIYPSHVETAAASDVKIVRVLDEAARTALSAGQRVLLICDGNQPLARTVGGGFASDFWGFNFFHNRPGTLGLLCDPAAPALQKFPTDSHSDWQWFNLAQDSQPLILDTILASGLKPIVQVIDNSTRCHKLGLIFELKVGPGRLLVCASDLIAISADHPEARQLLASLAAYAQSDQFQPAVSKAADDLTDLFQTTVLTTGAVATASSFDKGWQGYAPAQLIDGNESKGWLAAKGHAGPVWCQIDFKSPVDFAAAEVLWNRPGPGYDYAFQQSVDGKQWTTLREHCGVESKEARQRTSLEARGVSHLRILIEKTPGDQTAAIDEIRLFPSTVH